MQCLILRYGVLPKRPPRLNGLSSQEGEVFRSNLHLPIQEMTDLRGRCQMRADVAFQIRRWGARDGAPPVRESMRVQPPWRGPCSLNRGNTLPQGALNVCHQNAQPALSTADPFAAGN